jgi:hypothetical protein
MQGENPRDEVADVDWSAWAASGVEDEFGAFIVEVKYGVEVAVAEEYFAVQLQMEFVSVGFDAFE